jgi:hypothetical protein
MTCQFKKFIYLCLVLLTKHKTLLRTFFSNILVEIPQKTQQLKPVLRQSMGFLFYITLGRDIPYLLNKPTNLSSFDN